MSAEKRFVLAGFLLLLAPATWAYRRPRNPRYKKRAAAALGISFSTAPVGVVLIDRLKPGRWDPKVKLALELFAARRGKSSDSYDPEHPPAAVLSFDNAALDGDVGEAVFYRMVDRADFKFDDDWWKLVPLAYGRQKIRAAEEQFISISSAAWREEPTYLQFRKYMIESYQQSCRKVDRKDCRLYLARLSAGYARDELSDYAKAVLAAQKARPIALEEVGDSEEDKSPVLIRRGLRDVPEMKDLCRLLLAAGVDVWIVDLESRDLLLAAVGGYGIDPSRVVGISQGAFRDRLTAKIEEPVPFRAGKVDAVLAHVGRAPDLVVGASADDGELMAYGGGLRVLLDRGDSVLRARARKSGWLLQPSFVTSPSHAASSLIRSP